MSVGIFALFFGSVVFQGNHARCLRSVSHVRYRVAGSNCRLCNFGQRGCLVFRSSGDTRVPIRRLGWRTAGTGTECGTQNQMGRGQAVKARDFESRIRRFESFRPSQTNFLPVSLGLGDRSG